MDKASTVLFFSRTESRVLSGNGLASGLFQKRLSAVLSCASCRLVPSSTYFPFYISCTILATPCYPSWRSLSYDSQTFISPNLAWSVRQNTYTFILQIPTFDSLAEISSMVERFDRYLGKGTAELSQNHVDLPDLFYILVSSSSLCLLLFLGLRWKWGSRFRVSFQ